MTKLKIISLENFRLDLWIRFGELQLDEFVSQEDKWRELMNVAADASQAHPRRTRRRRSGPVGRGVGNGVSDEGFCGGE